MFFVIIGLLILIVCIHSVYNNSASKEKYSAVDSFGKLDEYEEFEDGLDDDCDELLEEATKEVLETYVPFEWRQDLKQGMSKNPKTGATVYDWKLKETWEDYPTPDYDAEHTYCRIAFDESGRTFYYRTRNPELKVGDLVYVPVGYKYEKKVGRIVTMEKYIGHNAPYPLERTKYIKGKVDDRV